MGAVNQTPVLQLVGVVLLMVGLGFYGAVIGRSPVLGLFGLLSCIGLLILYFFPKRCRYCASSQSYRRKECETCGAPV